MQALSANTSISDILLRLVNIDSLTGQEADITRFIRDTFSGWQGKTLFSPVNHTDAYFYDAGADKPCIGFYGHTDTVTNQQDFAPVIRNGHIYGCGASDMKGGLAVMMKLMLEIMAGRRQPTYNLYFVFYDAEEGPAKNNGLYTFLPAYKDYLACDLALVLEPTENSIQKGCVGSLHAEVTVKGKSGHSARPWEGENAIQKSWPLLKMLDETPPRKITADGLDFYEVYTTTLAKGGQTRNAVPAFFKLDINYRFAPGKTETQAAKDIEEYIRSLGDYDVSVTDTSPSGAVVTDNEILSRLTSRFNLKTEPKQAWTDIASLNAHGIPAVNFGPGSPSQAHQKNEYIREDLLNENLAMLTEFIFNPPKHG